jgi:hypothetical protein
MHMSRKGDRLRLSRFAGKWAHRLQGKPVELGDLLELCQPDGTWTSGRYAWTGRRSEAPYLLLCFYRGELRAGVKLKESFALRRPRNMD